MIQLSQQDVKALKLGLQTCKSVGIDCVAIVGDLISGINDGNNLCIISKIQLSCPPQTKVGIGRVTDLVKRLDLFSDDIDITLKAGETGDVSLINMSEKRSKAQFRCSFLSTIRHPKENSDVAQTVAKVKRDDLQAIVKAIRVYGAETVKFRISTNGSISVSMTDKTNDLFQLEIDNRAEFVDSEPSQPLNFAYAASNVSTIFDLAQKEFDTVTIVVGEGGSLTTKVNTHDIILLPSAE